MEMRLRHWLIATLGVCAAVAIWAAPARRDRNDAGGMWVGAATFSRNAGRLPQRVRATQIRFQLRAASSALAAAEARDQAVELLRVHTPGIVIAADSVPTDLRTLAEEHLAAVQELADPNRGTRFALAVKVSDADRPGLRSGVHSMLPGATDGETCLTILAVPWWWVERADLASTIGGGPPLGGAFVRGPCAFYAAFGEPGAEIKTWLSQWRYAFVQLADWDRAPSTRAEALPVPLPTQPMLRPLAFTQRAGPLAALAMGCTDGRLDACRKLLLEDPYANSPTAWRLEPPLRGDWIPPNESPSVTPLRYMFADLVRDIGAERFRDFWTSSEPAERAFRAATGEDLMQWASDWLRVQLGPFPQWGPGVRLREAAWLVVFAALCTALAIAIAMRRGGRRARGGEVDPAEAPA